MIYAGLLLGLSAAWPLAVAWRNTRGSTIRHALVWAWIAWAAWLGYGWSGGPVAAYAALTLTAAGGVAVFGARRPGAVAWHFVVIGLLVVLWMPWIESTIREGTLWIDGFRVIFPVAVFVVITLNYLLTRSGLAAAWLAIPTISLWLNLTIPPIGCGNQPWMYDNSRAFDVGAICLCPWIAWMFLRERRSGSDTDQLWSRFRDTFGAVWALRLREQFNAAAQNAGWPVRLGWFGLVPKTENPDPEWHAALVALMKRFHK